MLVTSVGFSLGGAEPGSQLRPLGQALQEGSSLHWLGQLLSVAEPRPLFPPCHCC